MIFSSEAHLIRKLKRPNRSLFRNKLYKRTFIYEAECDEARKNFSKKLTSKSFLLFSRVESSHKDFLFLLNDQADRDRWHEAIKGTIKLFPKLPEEPVPAEENKTWFSVIQSYEAKQADELTVYPGNFVKVFKPSNTWVKAILLNDKLSIGWLPTEYLSLETSLKSINEKEAKLRATKVNLDKLEKKLDPIIF